MSKRVIVWYRDKVKERFHYRMFHLFIMAPLLFLVAVPVIMFVSAVEGGSRAWRVFKAEFQEVWKAMKSVYIKKHFKFGSIRAD